MRVPPRVFVMSVVVTVPFALAMRDEMGKRAAKRQAIEDAKEAEQARLQAQRDEERQEAEDQRKRLAETSVMHSAFDKLFGDRPAELGPGLFDALSKGVNSSTAGPNYQISITGDIRGLRAEITFTKYCDHVHDWLVERWSGGEVWTNPVNRLRVRDRSQDCILDIEPYARVEQWVEKSADSTVPLMAVGKPEAALRKQLAGLDLTDTDTGFTWNDLGLEASSSPTTLEAFVKNGKVIGILASTAGTDLVGENVQERLEELYGKSIEDDTADYVYKWPKAKIVLDRGNAIEVRVGEIP
jgi:hypothetical protein